MSILVCGMGCKICIEQVPKKPGGIFFNHWQQQGTYEQAGK